MKCLRRPRRLNLLFALVALITPFVLACGARSGLDVPDGSIADALPEAALPACDQPPWIVFDYTMGETAFAMAAIHSDGTGLHTVDLGGDDGFLPSVSPDGRTLLYLTENTDGSEQSLKARDLATGATRTITQMTVDPLSGLEHAAVSHDNRWIAYGLVPDLHLIGFDGTGDHVLVPGPYNAGCCAWSYGHPQFSSDDSTIYFSTIGQLLSVPTAGGTATLLWQDQSFSNLLIPGFVFPNATFSSDRTQLVAEVGCATSDLRIYDVGTLPTSDPCTTGSLLITTGLSAAPNEAPNAFWGPTNLVVYEDGHDLYVIDANGGTATNVTSAITTAAGSQAADPVWAPGCGSVQ